MVGPVQHPHLLVVPGELRHTTTCRLICAPCRLRVLLRSRDDAPAERLRFRRPGRPRRALRLGPRCGFARRRVTARRRVVDVRTTARASLLRRETGDDGLDSGGQVEAECARIERCEDGRGLLCRDAAGGDGCGEEALELGACHKTGTIACRPADVMRYTYRFGV